MNNKEFSLLLELRTKKFAISIINLFKNPQKISEFREKIICDPTIVDWETIASEWMKYFVN